MSFEAEAGFDLFADQLREGLVEGLEDLERELRLHLVGGYEFVEGVGKGDAEAVLGVVSEAVRREWLLW